LAFALRNLQIQHEAARDAREQLEHNRRMAERGRTAPIDVVATETQVANLEQSIHGALEGVTRAENRLKEQITAGERDPLWGAAIIPTDPVELNPPATTLEEALAEAKENRPELLQTEAARQISGIETRYWREQTRPQIDLVSHYGAVGLAGTPVDNLAANPLTASIAELQARVNTLSQLGGLPPVTTPLERQLLPDFLSGGYGRSLTNLTLNRFNSLRVGVQVTFPWRDRTAEARLSRALIEGERVEAQREKLLLSINAEVRNSLQALRTAEARRRASAVARASSEKQYESERRRASAGYSTIFLVLERQTALTAARGNELRAQTDLNKAIADLNLSTGRALQANGISVRAEGR
jgi:outer membrane protein TolC